MQACFEHLKMGYTCTTGLWVQGNLCLNSYEGECTYELRPVPLENNISVVIQVDQSCFCIRSLCREFTVNRFYTVKMPQRTNLCLCKVFEIKGCDINLKMTETSYQEITAKYGIIKTVAPVSLGPSLEAVKSMMIHSNLKDIINNIPNVSQKVHVVVQHAANKIVNIGKRMQSKTTWWQTLFGNIFGDISKISMASLLTYPLGIIYIIMTLVIIYILVLTIYICCPYQRSVLIFAFISAE